jgi:hypothetical protein
MQTRDQGATRDKSLQTKGFRVQRAYTRVLRAHVLQRKCLTASDGSCLIVRYFFITWESVAPLNTFELLDRVAVDAMHEVVQPAHKRGAHQGFSELRVRGVPEQERRDCQPGSPRPEGTVDRGGPS